MIEQIQTEINAIRAQIDALNKEKSNLSVELDIIDDSPEGVVNAYRRRASDNIENAAQMKGIDDALAALKVMLEEKQSQLKHLTSLEPQTSSIQKIEDEIELTKKTSKNTRRACKLPCRRAKTGSSPFEKLRRQDQPSLLAHIL